MNPATPSYRSAMGASSAGGRLCPSLSATELVREGEARRDPFSAWASPRRAATRADNGGWPCDYGIYAYSVKDLTRTNVQGGTVAGALTGASAKQEKKVGSFPMNRFTLVFAVLSVVAAGSFASAPWRDLSVVDGYSESLGITPPYSDRENLNSSNCYDACAVIWGPYFDNAAAAPHAASR